jgi:N12 class adenine-specific DNA methylase
MGGRILTAYPSANILVATKKDFETKNRKKFCGRIATGDYDAIIIGHSQFEKIPCR